MACDDGRHGQLLSTEPIQRCHHIARSVSHGQSTTHSCVKLTNIQYTYAKIHHY